MANPEPNPSQPEQDLPNRSPTFLEVRRGDSPEDIIKQLINNSNRIDVLLFSVGCSEGDFGSSKELATWVRSFREGEGKGSNPNYTLIALVPSIRDTTPVSLHALREDLQTRDELVHELGVIVFDRTSASGGFESKQALQAWLVESQAAHSPLYFWLKAGLSTQLQPPPGDVESPDEKLQGPGVDEQRLQSGIEALNRAKWWTLEY